MALFRNPVVSSAVDPDRWLAAFHEGDRSTLEQCYREHYAVVAGVLGRLLPEADAETVTHEVFYRLLTDAHFRESFRGGRFAAWLTQVARNAGLDCLRRQRREQPDSGPFHEELEAQATARRTDDEVDAKLLIERFRRERLPPEYDRLFDARFLRQLPQRKAALELGMRRTTLVYQERRIRELLERFLLGPEGS